MSHLTLQPTSQAQWHLLIEDAITANGIQLREELAQYLELLLMRFTKDPTLLSQVMALEYLQSHHARGAIRRDQLRDVGDKCLLVSGLFPQRVEHRRTSISYYVNLGQSAYGILAELANTEFNHLYATLSDHFVPLMDVLLAMRTLQGDVAQLTPLQAHDLWSQTHSHQAERVLQHLSAGFITQPIDNNSSH